MLLSYNNWQRRTSLRRRQVVRWERDIAMKYPTTYQRGPLDCEDHPRVTRYCVVTGTDGTCVEHC